MQFLYFIRHLTLATVFIFYHPYVIYTTMNKPAGLLNAELLSQWASLCMRDPHHVYSPAFAGGQVQIEYVKPKYAKQHCLAAQGAHDLRIPLEQTFAISDRPLSGLRHIRSGESLDAAQVP